jgi:protein-S-isoprenylcysteine O-methyltransferase Ste14
MAEKTNTTDRGSLTALRIAFYGEAVVALLAGVAQRKQLPDPALFIVGLALMVAGLAIRIAAGRALGKWWSLRVEIKQGQALVQTGPYRLIRHPAYLGMLMVCLGIPIAFRSVWAAVVMALGVWPAVFHRVQVEEQLLRSHFGDQYDAYARRTRRLVPWVL